MSESNVEYQEGTENELESKGCEPIEELETVIESETEPNEITETDLKSDSKEEIEEDSEFETDSELGRESDIEIDGIEESEHSNDSIIDDDNEVEEIPSPDWKEQVADRIISFFKVKRPIRFIDKDTDEDLVSYEESEFRLIILGIVISTILSFVALMLVAMYSQGLNARDPAMHTYHQVMRFSFSQPKVAVMDADGEGFLLMYNVFESFTFVQDWILKLPDQKPFGIGNEGNYWNEWNAVYIKPRQYFGFTDRNQVYISLGDGHRNMIVIDPNKTHRTVLGSQFKYGYVWDTSSVRMGQYLWIFSGQDSQNQETGNVYGYIQKTFLWSIKKSRWLAGPKLPQNIANGCGLALNRSHAQLLVNSVDNLRLEGMTCLSGQECDSCVKSWIFNFETWFWTFENACLFNIPEPDPDEWLKTSLKHEMSCTQFQGKNMEKTVDLWIHLNGLNVLLKIQNGSVMDIETDIITSKAFPYMQILKIPPQKAFVGF